MNSAGHKASKRVVNESLKRNLFEAVLVPLIFSCWVAAGVLWGTTARAAEVYVFPGGAQSAPYDSWTNAFASLQDAFDYVTDGDTIQLAAPVSIRCLPAPAIIVCRMDRALLVKRSAQRLTRGSPGPGCATPPISTATVASTALAATSVDSSTSAPMRRKGLRPPSSWCAESSDSEAYTGRKTR